MHPIFAKVLRVSKNSAVTYGRGEPNRCNVESPAPHGLFESGEELFWRHPWTGWEFAFHALRHQQFDESAADIHDENSSLHELPSAGRTRTSGRDRTIALRLLSVRASRLCCWASTL